MIELLKEILKKDLTDERLKRLQITDEELEEAMEQIGRDLVFNYLVFKKDVTYKVFIENLSTYLYLYSKKVKNKA
jgi:hypothetical protein